MKFSSVFKWCVVLVLLATVAGGGALCWVWLNSDRLVHTAVTDAFRKHAPDWDIRLQRSRFDGTDKVHLYGLDVLHPTDGTLFVHIPEAIVTVERDALIKRQEVDILHVEIRRPRVRLARRDNGLWNWQNLPPLRLKKDARPAEWLVSDARFDVELNYGEDYPRAQFSLVDGDMKLVPSSRAAYDFRGRIRADRAGTLNLVGNWDKSSGQWKLVGAMQNLAGSDDLMQLAANSSPEVRRRMQGFEDLLVTAASRLRGEAAPMTAAADTPSMTVRSGRAPSFGVSGTLDLNFEVKSAAIGAPSYRVWLGLSNGAIDNNVLPFALHNVNAQWYRDPEVQIIRIENAANDRTRIRLDAEFRRNEQGVTTGFVSTDVRDLPLDQRLERVLPESIRKLLAPLHASGLVSLTGTWQTDHAGKWHPRNARLNVREMSVLFDKFRYPVQGIHGAIVQRGDQPAFDMQLRGHAGPHPVTLSGEGRNPGPEAEVRYVIEGSLPVDEQFRLACEAPARRVMELLNAGGTATGKVVVYRPPGANQKSIYKIDADITDGRMKYSHFPYPLSELTGHVTYESASRKWTFRDLRAFHDETLVTCSGDYDGATSPGRLHLDLSAKDGRLDEDLRSAVGSGLRVVWDHLRPTGTFDLRSDIDWIAAPGRSAQVSVRQARFRNGTMTPESFPYRLTNVSGELAYTPGTPESPNTGQVTVNRLTAEHGPTKVDAAGWARIHPNGNWTLHFNRLNARNVVPDHDFKIALPESLRETFNVLNPTAPFAIENSELEIRSWEESRGTITAAWSTDSVFSGGTISAGMDLHDIRGRVTNRGTWDGLVVRNQGEVRLDSVKVLDHELTNVRGPYRLVDTELTIGSPEVFRKNPGTIPLNERITADAFRGKLSCDSLVNLTEPGSYRVFVTATDADLRSYAATHMPREKNLRGKMNGWLYLSGLGSDEKDLSGSGQLQISPAEIYELPVVVGLLNALGNLNFSVPDHAAFRYALLNFRVADSRFLFDQIDLVGRSFSLRGRGRVGFDSRVNLDFYSKPARSASAIPVIGHLVSNATANWVHVKVDGTLERPRQRVQPNMDIDGALKGFLQAFNTALTGPVPPLRSPITFRNLPSRQPR